ncbi:MAG: DUF2110 family protein [Promethearchaeia archaeon]
MVIKISKRLVLLDRFHNFEDLRSIKDYQAIYSKYLNLLIGEDFPDVEITVLRFREHDKRFEVEIRGPEEEFVANFLKAEIGALRKFTELEEGDTLKGQMVDVGEVGFGLFIDCGITVPTTDVLIPLHILREQLCNFRQVSVRDIINAYGFIDHFPLHVEITEIDRKTREIEGKIAPESLRFFRNLINDRLERIFVSGATKSHLKKAIVKNGHYEDVLERERHFFLDHMVTLREGTTAPGMIAEIGHDLQFCDLSALRPQKIQDLFL